MKNLKDYLMYEEYANWRNIKEEKRIKNENSRK